MMEAFAEVVTTPAAWLACTLVPVAWLAYYMYWMKAGFLYPIR